MNILIFMVFQNILTTSNNLQRNHSLRGSVKKAFDRVGRVFFSRSNSKSKEPIYEEIRVGNSIWKNRTINHDTKRKSLPRLPTQRKMYEEFAERGYSCPECLLHRKRNNSESNNISGSNNINESNNISGSNYINESNNINESNHISVFPESLTKRTRNISESSPKCFYYKFLNNIFGLKKLYTGNSLNDENGYTIMHGSLPVFKNLKNEMAASIQDFENKVINQFDDLDDEITTSKYKFLLKVSEKLSLDFKVVLFEYAINRDPIYVQFKVEEFKNQLKEANVWSKSACLCDLCKVKFY